MKKFFWSSLQFTSLSHSSSHPLALHLIFHIFNLPLHLTHYLPSQSSCHLSFPLSIHLSSSHPLSIHLSSSHSSALHHDFHLTFQLFITFSLFQFTSSSHLSLKKFSISSSHPSALHHNFHLILQLFISFFLSSIYLFISLIIEKFFHLFISSFISLFISLFISKLPLYLSHRVSSGIPGQKK